jgi:uncharacterized membrane protein YdjX (TVP38/TMEM64 family)
VHLAINFAVAPIFHHLWFFFLFLFVDALAFPLASTLYVAYMGTQHAPWFVAAVGASATTAGSVAQYLLVRWLLSRHAALPAFLTRMRTRLERTARSAQAATFGALFLVYATPLSAGPLRLLAAAARYPLWQFALAILLGCLPYYWILATMGKVVHLPAWVYGALLTGVVLIGIGQLALKRLRKNDRER